jgi:peptidoglycan hydrolase-like protein with peptidoglycan-binding domain
MATSLKLSAPAALAALALILAGCGGGDEPEPASEAPEQQAEEGATGAGGASEPAEGNADATQIWLTTGEQLKPVERKLAPGSELEAAAEALVEGPTDAEEGGNLDAASEIPAGTSVESVDVGGDGTATAELSREFFAQIPAKPAARTEREQATLDARLSQVTYTLTQFDEVESVKVVSGGISAGPAQDRGDFKKPSGGAPPIQKAKGSPSDATRELQQRLARLNYLPRGAVDGLDGYRTQQAVIAFQSWEGLARDGVVGPITQAALDKAKKPRPKSSGPSKRIEVYRQKGVALIVKDGKTKRAIHVSTGAAATPTPAGTYSVFRKEKNSWSVPFQQWLPFASYFNAGIAFHGYAQVPTYPASHGCVRVPSPEARFVYRFASIGTAVVVI